MNEDTGWCFLVSLSWLQGLNSHLVSLFGALFGKLSISLHLTLAIWACCKIVSVIYGNLADGVSSQRRDCLMFQAKTIDGCLSKVL